VTTTYIPICSVYRPSLNTAYQPRTLTMTYKSLHLLLTGLKLYYTASNKLATTSGDYLSRSLAPQQRTTSSCTSSTPNSPCTLRPHLARPPSRRFITPLQRDGLAINYPALTAKILSQNQPHSPATALGHITASRFGIRSTKPKTSDNKKLEHDALVTTRSNANQHPDLS
jgi:hypothetical protein